MSVMYASTIIAVSEEVLRLLANQHDLVTELLRDGNILKDDSDRQARSVDRKTAEFWRKTLEDEKAKVEGLELTLAVVGTMKAGKSTSINAIIGQEVLPNRNRPMTTLPTVIRHKVGQDEPHLTFLKPEPFNRAILRIKQELSKMSGDERAELPINSSEDGKLLIEDILSDRLSTLKSSYIGTAGVYSFLKSINDISRMCDPKNLNLPSPLTEYTSIREFPTIEVEFFHLKGKKQQVAGQLSLIDTPGPNEAGQVHLRGILEEQLQKASAVLAILDYTQLNSEADAEVRRAIEQVAKYSRDRLFVLVNKFDQRDRNSMDEKEVKRYVSGELFDHELPIERVFPVSSQLGYLANFALNEISTKGKLPDPDTAEWVEDFGQRALGVDWEEDLEDVERLKSSAERIWKRSMMLEPLEEVIGKAYAEAALIALKSAVEKMNHYDERIVEYLQMRDRSIHIDIKTLQSFISGLEKDIARIEKTKKEADSISTAALQQLRTKTNSIFDQGNKTLTKLIETLFNEGKRLEMKRNQIELANKQNKEKWVGLRFFKEFPSDANDIYINIAKNGKNVFSSKREANEFLDKIDEAIRADVGHLSNDIQNMVNESVQQMEAELQKRIDHNVSAVLEHAAQTLNDAFDLKISFKQKTITPIKVEFDQITNNSIEEKNVEKTKTRYERKWYTLWLREHEVSYTVYEDEFHIDTKKIGADVLKELNTSQKKLQKDLEKYVSQELGSNLTAYFDELKLYLDKFRGNLLDGVKDKQEKEETLGKLSAALKTFLDVASVHQQDLDFVGEALMQEIRKKEGSLV
ncbi:dynamin family protein [Paenibacillus cymbidii]|uniref:dynamin family protein n=1 Tax=Paenibacillus cymbidii TaxID=1639034 RepID=UPI00107FD536|nr:dynamin family protein [Paenibacillus cymbidii]